MVTPMLPGIAEVIIAREENSSRFENFCADLCEKVEGTTFVTTSRSYDRARDAIGLGRSKGTHANVALCTLNKDIKPKLVADVEQLVKHAKPDHVYYCWNQRLSQKRADELAAIIRGKLPKSSVTVLGAEELAKLSEKYPAIFERHYGPEIRSVEPVAQGIKSDTRGLALALVSFASDNAQQLRTEVSTAAILNIVASHQAADASEIAHYL